MLTVLLVLGFALVLWRLWQAEQRVKRLYRLVTEADRRISRRLYEFTHAIDDVLHHVHEIEWNTAPLALANVDEKVTELRGEIEREWADRVPTTENPDAVLPSDDWWQSIR